MSKILIGLAGKRRVGKSTVARTLCALSDTTQMSFAGPIKKMVSALGVEDEYIYGDKKEEVIPNIGVTGRFLLQSLGTQWGRDMVHKDLWTNALFQSSDYLLAMKHRGVVIDDVRFPSEVEAIRAHGGIVARVQWGNEITPVVADEFDAHPSEAPLPDIDYIIYNSLDIPAVCVQLSKMLVDLSHKHC